MNQSTQQKEVVVVASGTDPDAGTRVTRIKSEDLLQQQREVEIDHHGRIYRLRLTQLNKLILTA
ncbi:hemin uptake protein HemP [Noviherbaspirillum aerium]|uniref:hemin uptake protein HemP n=1 Tax=Noviherbaspirillum aerium TaxID=2588497 RepID=UPI00124DB67E|nr:hemin uptake protein HemP [Noviherbaspirillum aerium]